MILYHPGGTGRSDEAQDLCGYSSNPFTHSGLLFLHLHLYCSPHSFILPPSPLMTCQVSSWPPRQSAHMTEKFPDHWAVPSPLLLSPHFFCREGRLSSGEGAPDTAQDPQIPNLDPEHSFPGLRPFPGPTSPWAWGASHPRT